MFYLISLNLVNPWLLFLFSPTLAKLNPPTNFRHGRGPEVLKFHFKFIEGIVEGEISEGGGEGSSLVGGGKASTISFIPS
jgi:hypothetical protein